MQHRNLKCFECNGKECELQPPPICENAHACWKTSARGSDGKRMGRRGCIPEPSQTPHFCDVDMGFNAKNLRTQCCQENFCNGGPFPLLENSSTGPDIASILKWFAAFLGPPIGAILIICGILYMYNRTERARRDQTIIRWSKDLIKLGMDARMDSTMPANYSLRTLAARGEFNIPEDNQATTSLDSNTMRENPEGRDVQSDSDLGLQLPIRTLAKQVTMVECLSRGGGKFGRQIWRGIYQGQNVAVKVNWSFDEIMWKRETEVYSLLTSPPHENILEYVGSDIFNQSGCSQLWLVTHYHEAGSLYNYLGKSSEQLSHRQMFDLCLSVTNGVHYIHDATSGKQEKIAMAHRNLSSKNIIVKANGICAIANLEHVVTQNSLLLEDPGLEQVSKRYMSPELLDQTLDLQYLTSFQRADVYSLGLVLWEVCRRCVEKDIAEGNAAPYSEWLLNGDKEPTMEEMQKIVVDGQSRPTISNCWHTDSTLAKMGALIEECWYTAAMARLPILQVKKTLVQIAKSNPDVDVSPYENK